MIPSSRPGSSQEGGPQQSTSAFWYGVVLSVVPLLASCTGVWVLTRPGFYRQVPDAAFGVLGYGAESKGLNCDVVLFGDSTALADFSPAVIEERTGLTACNVSEIRSASDFAGVNQTLDLYLKHNRAPRFIVTGWTPDALDIGHGHIPMANGVVITFAHHYMNGTWLRDVMLRNPADFLRYATWSDNRLFLYAAQHSVNIFRRNKHMDSAEDQARQQRVQQKGQWATSDPPQTTCEIEPLGDPWTKEHASAGIAAFRRRYTTDKTTVLVYVTPVANCDPNLAHFREMSQGLTDNVMQAWAVDSFNLRDVHLTPEGAKRFTNQVADDLVHRMQGPRNPETDKTFR